MTKDEAEELARNWDETANICANHRDRTGTAAFRTCANGLRRAFGLRERDLWSNIDMWLNVKENATSSPSGDSEA